MPKKATAKQITFITQLTGDNALPYYEARNAVGLKHRKIAELTTREAHSIIEELLKNAPVKKPRNRATYNQVDTIKDLRSQIGDNRYHKARDKAKLPLVGVTFLSKNQASTLIKYLLVEVRQ